MDAIAARGRLAVLLAGVGPEVERALRAALPGVDLATARTGAEALEGWRSHAQPVVVTDESLVGPTATEVCRVVGAGAHLVLCLTPAVAAALTGAQLEGIGVDRVFFHPVATDALVREVAAALGVRPQLEAPAPAAGATMADAIAGLWEKARPPMLEQVQRLEETVAAAIEGRLEREAVEQAQSDAHKIAGSAGMFGFPDASRQASEVERLLAPQEELGPAQVLELSERVVAIRAQLEQPRGAADGPAPAGQQGPVLVVASERAAVIQRLGQVAVGLRAELRAASDAATARQVPGVPDPDAVVVDLALPGALGLIAELASAGTAPVLALVGDEAPTDRLEAARAGAYGFMPDDAAVHDLADWLRAVRGGGDRPTILAVDDDPVVLQALATLLEQAGHRFVGLQDPLQTAEALEAARPDLVVLDVEMPLVSGYEVCRMLRNDPRWGTVPVLFLTARTAAADVEQVFGAGADDYVAKPVAGPELLTRIANRLERTSLHRQLADTDPLTEVANRRSSLLRLDHLLHLSRRYEQPLGFAVVDLDHFKHVNDRYGHATGDAVLRRLARLLALSFRGEDVVARWGGEEFVVGMYGMALEDAATRLEDAQRLFASQQRDHPDGEGLAVTFSAGVAEYPSDGFTIDALYRAADEALYRAKAEGRDRVLASRPRKEGVRRADVVVVEDDEVLLGLLTHALQTRGLRWERASDGAQAVELLVGPPPQVHPRAVLLDVDLPGMSGLDVLRRMRSAGVLERTRVIMLTARAAEHDVMAALELGAFDHVAKPFSVPVLMERVGKALTA